MTLSYGVTTGHVIDVKDPDSMGRVKVRFDRLGTGQQTTDGYWAPVATLMSGPDRGSWFMPEADDEVLVAFDHGDVNHPFVIGYLWNGKQQPPVGGIDEHTRRIKSVSGHVLELSDVKGKEQVHIKTNGGHEVTLDDTSGSSGITIVSANKNSVKLDDVQKQITVQTQSGVQIALKDSGEIDILVPTGTLSVTCDTATITATSQMTLTSAGSLDITASDMSITAGSLDILAGFTSFTGVIEASTVIAPAIVGSAYTPGPGDTLGL
jgi:uncharacterized protein involved in type VI secretion and phage assembly